LQSSFVESVLVSVRKPNGSLLESFTPCASDVPWTLTLLWDGSALRVYRSSLATHEMDLLIEQVARDITEGTLKFQQLLELPPKNQPPKSPPGGEQPRLTNLDEAEYPADPRHPF